MLEAATAVSDYWSDGSVGVEIQAQLRNDGDLAVDTPQTLVYRCDQNDETIPDCGEVAELSLEGGFGPAKAAFAERVPAGDVSFRFDLEGVAPLTVEHRSDPKIVNVDRQVWECFSDTSNVGTSRELGDGIGCGGWEREKLVKWDQSRPINVWVTGQESWVEPFKEVLGYLGSILNLRFAWVTDRGEAKRGMVVHLGVPKIPGGNLDETCPRGGAGCARINYRRDAEIHRARVRFHSDERDEGKAFGDLPTDEQERIKTIMLHESVHALTWMQHRPGPGSIMEAGLTPGRKLSPMDVALLRLHGHPLVRPGMSLSEIEPLLVSADEVIDPVLDVEFGKWGLVRNAYDGLRHAGTARFMVRATSYGCLPEFGWSEYQVGNLTRALGGFSWVRLDRGGFAYFTVALDLAQVEHWAGSSGRWVRLTDDQHASRTLGWRRDLADPHIMLERILYFADWDEVGRATRADGLEELTVPLNLDSQTDLTAAEIVLVIDPETGALIEYDAEWTLSGQQCDVFRIQAKDGELGGDFTFPQAILAQSDALGVCQVDVGMLPRRAYSVENWHRHCFPPSRMGQDTGFSRTFKFSLDRPSVVRAEVESEVNTWVYLSVDGRVLEEGAGNFDWDGWVHRYLPPGDYAVDVVTEKSLRPEFFEISIGATPVPGPTHVFKSVSAGSRHMCGLLVDGTPVCWGWNRHGQVSPPHGEKFESITSGTVSCGLKKDGQAVCWGADDGGQASPPPDERFVAIDGGFGYTCGLRHDGSVVCWGWDSFGKTSPPAGERFKAISCGPIHSCGLRLDGTAVCWGSNLDGQAAPPEGEVFTSIVSGEEHSCALRPDGTPVCWGSGGQKSCYILPNGSTGCRIVDGDGPPTPPAGVRFASLSTGAPTCGIKSDGTALCWGRDEWGQASAPEGRRFISLSASGATTCGILDDGSPLCWGWDQFGQASPYFKKEQTGG